jgi:tol-pal system protein YbgF
MMLKLRALVLLGLCCSLPAQAVLFPDDEARKQIQLLEARVLVLEELAKDQTKSMLDLQGQIESLNGDLRKLRGQNEELAHGLQDAEKREKDFYVDLDTRLRRFESVDNADQSATGKSPNSAVHADPNDVSTENRAFEIAYGLFKGGSFQNAAKAFQDFQIKFPDSVYVPNAMFWLASAQFELKQYASALETYQNLLKIAPNTSKTPEVLLNIAGCQQELKQAVSAQKTLKQLVAKYPSSEAAAKAKKLLISTK